MNPAEALRVRNKVTGTLNSAVSKVLRPFLGQALTKAVLGDMARKSRPLVSGARSSLQKSATQQYKDFLAGKKPLPPPKLDRFSGDSWVATLDKVTGLSELEAEDPSFSLEFDEDLMQEILNKADYWARDAERGSLIDYAKRDKRIYRWARIDPQPPSCPFCTVLISRGAVYKSEESTGAKDKAKFHTGCTCTPVLVAADEKDTFDGVEFQKQALDEYEQATRLAGSSDLGEVVAAMKELRKRKNSNPEGNTRT